MHELEFSPEEREICEWNRVFLALTLLADSPDLQTR